MAKCHLPEAKGGYSIKELRAIAKKMGINESKREEICKRLKQQNGNVTKTDDTKNRSQIEKANEKLNKMYNKSIKNDNNYTKNISKCEKGEAHGGYALEKLKKIAAAKGINTHKKKKKELCAALRNVMQIKRNSPKAGFNVSRGVTLADVYANQNPIGYFMSEKLNGVRAIWTGHELRSRANKPIVAPNWFLSKLPKGFALNGELFVNRGKFEETASIVKKKVPVDNEWRKIRFMVFNAPMNNVGFKNRYSKLQSLKNKSGFTIVDQKTVQSKNNMNLFYKNILSRGGEGIMLRNPEALYAIKRTKNLLKVKPTNNAEAVVVNKIEGKGKNTGKLGAFKVRMGNKSFKIGTGFSDAQRREYWRENMKGKTLTFTHRGLTKYGVPRAPAFMRIRENKILM